MKKSLIVLGAAAMVAAAAVPALAFENEFHGMYRAYGFLTNNIYSGGGTFNLNKDGQTSSYVEQRARIQYIAKASDDLKLVTHFELDALFGGKKDGKYGTLGDAGAIDADAISIETKNVYLDFNVGSQVNAKVGIQPFNDAYQGTFGNIDGAGAVFTGKFGVVTPSLGWFRLANELGSNGAATALNISRKTADLTVLDVKAALTKDVSVGGSYYVETRDTSNVAVTGPFATSITTAPAAGSSGLASAAQLIHMLGLNAAAKVGPAAITGFANYQFGEFNDKRDLAAYSLGAIAKVNVGVGNVNVSGLYLSGEKDVAATATGNYKGFQQMQTGGGVSYFNASNMWLLVRNGASINTSTAIGSNDMTKGGRGLLGLFAGFDGAAGKVFYATNVGYA
ncbi:MAG TPA: hypothetical protein VN642_17225, partial [Dongiaceae bacterium]|nr:hypothetical protein [Dongiaceae bacterium]